MGFWDSIKNAAIKAKCGVGIHGGNYKLIDGETCKYSKLCPDCNRTIQKEQHKYGEENYKYDFKCTTVKKCIDCGAEQEGERHERFVEIAVDDYCNVKERCVRCFTERVHGKRHNWYLSGSSDTYRHYKCSVCGEEKEERKASFR